MNQTGNHNSESDDAPWTVLRLLQWTTDFFRSKGSDSPRLDAEILLAHARSCSRVELYTAYASVPGDDERVAFREMVRRRGSGMPVAQIVGYREFYSLSFRVSEATLIPRPETEHLIVEAIDCVNAMGSFESNPWIADLGTGSGVIAITLAKHLPQSKIVATDISVDALQIAKWNAEKHGVSERSDFVQSDLLSVVTQPQHFSLICSNPPYITVDEYSELDRSVRDFEPKTALVSGPKGTEIIERVIELCRDRLMSGGWCIVEMSPMIADSAMAIAEEAEIFAELKFVKDLAGHRRLLSMRRR
ncbi:MAG: peptide chain release factor N(5)-glutamine methyltransferase [Rubripirellula sp.]|nr:peptide chain release factor N(5)-glutamine methyltransferase [Rubripirellula sp.]